ncbi:hypothetical protein ACOKGD_13695 [Microbacterium phosphatis]|uniref:hypothetical protein n=1 Tax=Microbacterium phosphatis TaxID=3140248 RepID=UPI0031409121
MIPIAASALMWLLVANLLILRRGRADRSILYSAVTIAIAMTFNVDTTYRWVDPVLGGTNVVTLLADLTLMVGVFFLGRGVAKAMQYQSRVAHIALGRSVLAVAVVGAVTAFACIDRGETTTTFMLDLGAQPAAATYSIIQFTYDGVVLTAMAAAASRQIGRSRGSERLPAVSVLVGSLSGLALSLVVIAMDLAHIVGNLTLMDGFSAVYDPLFLATFVFLCLGLGAQPALRWVRARSREEGTRALLAQVTPIWERAIDVRPGLSQLEPAFHREDAETQLHRQIVEVRDAVIDPRVAFALSDAERLAVESAEAHLMAGEAGASLKAEAPHVGCPKEPR